MFKVLLALFALFGEVVVSTGKCELTETVGDGRARETGRSLSTSVLSFFANKTLTVSFALCLAPATVGVS